MNHLWISTHDERGRKRPRASEDISSAQGEVVDQWREGQAQIRVRIERNERAERAALLGFILPGSTLDRDRVIPSFKPPFDIIHRIAQEARRITQDIKRQADGDPTACPTLIPRPDSNGRPGR